MLAASSVNAAELSVSGAVDVWAGSRQSPTDTDSTSMLDSGGMQTSYLGIGMTEEVADGITATASLQTFFRPDSAEAGRFDGDAFYARAANVGLSGAYGTIKGGRNTSPYFLPVVFTNPFGSSFDFSPAIAHTFRGTTEGDSGWSDSISYSMPSSDRVSANFVYAFGEVAGESDQNKIGGNIIYRNEGVMVVAAAQQVAFGITGTTAGSGSLDDQQTAVMLGANGDLGDIKLFGQYHRVENNLQSGDQEVDTITTGASIPAGPGKALAAYAYSDTATSSGQTERGTYAVGYDYIVNKSVDVYANYYNDDPDNADDGTTYGVGMRYRF